MVDIIIEKLDNSNKKKLFKIIEKISKYERIGDRYSFCASSGHGEFATAADLMLDEIRFNHKKNRAYNKAYSLSEKLIKIGIPKEELLEIINEYKEIDPNARLSILNDEISRNYPKKETIDDIIKSKTDETELENKNNNNKTAPQKEMEK